jgi:hypothetical protein
MRRRRTRISFSEGFGPFRIGLSAGRTGLRAFGGVRTGRRGWTSVSAPLGGRRRRSGDNG